MKKYRLAESLEIDHFLDGEDVIFDVGKETTYVLNYAATIALQVCLNCNNIAYSPAEEFKKEVLEKLVDVNEAELYDDFETVVRMFLDRGILEIYEE